MSEIDSNMLALYAIVGGGTNILVYCIGIVASIVFWRRAPRSAAMAIGALLLLLLIQVTAPVLMMFLARTVGVRAFANWQAIVNAGLSIVHAIGVGVLIIAIFLDRRGTLRE